MVPFKSFGAFSYLHSIVTMAVSCISSEIKRDVGCKSWFLSASLYVSKRGAVCRWGAFCQITLTTCFNYLTLNNIVTLKSGLEVTQDHSNGTIRKLGCGFLFTFYSNHCSILHQFWDKARHCAYVIMRCLSVCVHVWSCVTFVHTLKMNTHIFKIFSP